MAAQVSQEDDSHWVDTEFDDLLKHRSEVSTATAVWLDVQGIVLLIRFNVADITVKVQHVDT